MDDHGRVHEYVQILHGAGEAEIEGLNHWRCTMRMGKEEI
jgi:hypothetical protein